MSSFAVHPIEGDNDRDTQELDFVLRLLVIDVATGKPVQGAWAQSPAIDQETLDSLGRHPYRILNTRDVTFTNADTGDMTMKVKTLRTFVPDPAGVTPPTNLKSTFQVVPEVFFASANEKVFDAKGNIYVRIDGPEIRYVCIEGGGVKYAQRCLATMQDGILEIPVSFDDWFYGTSVPVSFRDLKIAPADGFYPVEMGHQALGVTLYGNPTANFWTLGYGFGGVDFEDTLAVQFPAIGKNPAGYIPVWAVRKVEECTSAVRTKSDSRPANTTVSGVVIHYNSGYYVNEKRGTATVQCKNVFDNQPVNYMKDNQYLADPELALQILKKLFSSGKTGYHYHIKRDGTILFVVDENRQCYHSGASREPNSVTAESEVVGEGPPQTKTQTISGPREQLDKYYIGINLMGHHADSKFHFTEEQCFYLDRLIENIRMRQSGVKWYGILGHDEVRAAFKAAHPSSTQHNKTDPGAALKGGMAKLRGRHGAF